MFHSIFPYKGLILRTSSYHSPWITTLFFPIRDWYSAGVPPAGVPSAALFFPIRDWYANAGTSEHDTLSALFFPIRDWYQAALPQWCRLTTALFFPIRDWYTLIRPAASYRLTSIFPYKGLIHATKCTFETCIISLFFPIRDWYITIPLFSIFCSWLYFSL